MSNFFSGNNIQSADNQARATGVIIFSFFKIFLTSKTTYSSNTYKQYLIENTFRADIGDMNQGGIS
jgi:hypothetical protein